MEDQKDHDACGFLAMQAVIRCMNPPGIRVMRLDQMPGQSHSVASASSCMPMRTCLEEGIKPHRFAGIFPEQFLTETSGHREPVVAADQRMVIRRYRDDLVSFVHDVSHAPFLATVERRR